MQFTKRAVKSSDGVSGVDFLKIAPGSNATGVFRGECLEFWQSWPQGGTKQVFDKPTPGASSRFRLNFVIVEEGKAVAKIFEFPVTVYNQLAELSENIDIASTKVKISRMGADKKTQWMIIPLGPLDKKGLAAIEAVELKELKAPIASTEAPPSSSDEVPF